MSSLQRPQAGAPFNDPTADRAGTANLFSARNETFHAQRRRQVGNAYSMQSLVGFRAYVENVVERFVAHLDEFASRKEAIDLGHELAALACEVARCALGCSRGLS